LADSSTKLSFSRHGESATAPSAELRGPSTSTRYPRTPVALLNDADYRGAFVPIIQVCATIRHARANPRAVVDVSKRSVWPNSSPHLLPGPAACPKYTLRLDFFRRFSSQAPDPPHQPPPSPLHRYSSIRKPRFFPLRARRKTRPTIGEWYYRPLTATLVAIPRLVWVFSAVASITSPPDWVIRAKLGAALLRVGVDSKNACRPRISGLSQVWPGTAQARCPVRAGRKVTLVRVPVRLHELNCDLMFKAQVTCCSQQINANENFASARGVRFRRRRA